MEQSSPSLGPAQLADLESELLKLVGVSDCAVVERSDQDERVAVFLVAANPGQEQRLLGSVQLPDGVHPRLVPMSRIPRTVNGDIDRSWLERVTLANESAASQLERVLTSMPTVARGAVLVEPAHLEPQRLHLSDLLEQAAKDADTTAATPDDAPPLAVEVSTRAALVESPPLALSEDTPRTLGPTLVRAAKSGSAPRITYVSDVGDELAHSFQQVLDEAERTLAGLRELGLQPGTYVLFQLSEPRNIIPSFWACLLGGFVPVICPLPPSYDAVTTDLEKLRHVWTLLGKPTIVCELSRQAGLTHLAQQLQTTLETLPIVERLREHAADARHHVAAPDDVAFLSLTSGSTGTPKCIALTHANILSRARGTNLLCDQDSSDVILNWLPFDHIGSISDWHLRCVDLQCHMVYCTKERVLGNPLNWLQLIARFRITHSWAPNFAYALINSAIAAAPPENWDLSCMKSLLTAGEAVSSATVEEFLTRLARFGLARSAVRPAFGMAELGSGITYFRPTEAQPYAAMSVDRQSLTGTLSPLPASHPRSISFTGLGTVIAGMAMRIVDEQGNVVPEKTIGNLHVKGEAVTPGYVENPEANAKVFVGEGWFDTGDRGFIADRQLFLTGRSKDTIIVNGANYYPGELESAAESVQGVLVSFTAACTVRIPGAAAERVALFFCHEPLPPHRQAELLQEVQARVAKKIGVKADYLVPVNTDQIPKTAIGKIQRKELVRRFEDGEFSAIVKRTDCLLGNDQTLPNWFLQPVWRRQEVRQRAADVGTLVWLADAAGLGAQLHARAKQAGLRSVLLGAGSSGQPGDDQRSCDRRNPEQVSALLGQLAADLGSIGTLVDLSGYAPSDEKSWREREALDASIHTDTQTTLDWLQALQRAQLLPKRYCVIASAAQPVGLQDTLEPGRVLAIPLLKALELGVEGFAFQHIDVPYAQQAEPRLLDRLWTELLAADRDQEVAYRADGRWVRALKLVEFEERAPSHPLLEARPNELYLVTGGLGGLGVQLTRLLLRQNAHVLLVGRRAIDSNTSGSPDKDAERLAELMRLGSVLYRQADVTNSAELGRAVEDAERHYGLRLSGVFHLAGVAREATVLDENSVDLARVLAPKVHGSWAIDRLLDAYPNAFCVLFSSAATTVGTSLTGAYAMANAHLDALAHVHRGRGRKTHSLNWSPWEDVGMNGNSASSAALRAKGLMSIPLRQGLNSMLVALNLPGPRVIIGLNAENPRIAAQLVNGNLTQTAELVAFATRSPDAGPLPAHVTSTDARGQELRIALIELAKLPEDATGAIDRAALHALVAGQAREKKPASSEVEKQLVTIFCRVLGQDSVGINESFFDLGGTSLLSLRLFGEIERQFGTRLPAATLMEAPSIEQLAARLSTGSSTTRQDSLVPIAPRGEGPAMFLVHDADGETILYRNLANALNGTPVYGLQPFGTEAFPALHTSIDEMSNHYIERMREVQPHGPYLVGGMCAGGVIAFDMACKLQAKGESVALVALLDAADAHAPKHSHSQRRAGRFAALFSDPNLGLVSVLQSARRKVVNLIKHEAQLRVNGVRKRASVRLLRELRLRNVSIPGLLSGIDPRTVYEYAQARHAPGTFTGKLSLFRATKADPRQEAAGFTDTPAIETTSDSLLGWGTRATQGVDVVDVPGGHSSMLQEPNVATLASELTARIRAALRP